MWRVDLEWRVKNNLSTDLTFWVQVLGVLIPLFTRTAGKKEEAGVWTGETELDTGWSLKYSDRPFGPDQKFPS